MLGIFAERSAVFHMIADGENEIVKALCILPDDSGDAPLDDRNKYHAFCFGERGVFCDIITELISE